MKGVPVKRLLDTNPNNKELWDSVYSNKEYALLDQDLLRFSTMANYTESKPCKIIDLGCGEGIFALVLSKMRQEAEVYGVDVSPHSITEACKKVPQGMFTVSDVCATPFPDEYFEYVCSGETLEHLDDPQKLINEAYRLLKKDGVLILTTPYLDHLPSVQHVWEFDYPDLEKMCSKFSQVFVFPFAGQSVTFNDGILKYPMGNWSQIFVLARK